MFILNSDVVFAADAQEGADAEAVLAAAAFKRMFRQLKPHALHRVRGPSGPLLHSGVSREKHWWQ